MGISCVFVGLQVFEVIKKREETRQAEMAAKAAEFKAIQAQAETVRFPIFWLRRKISE